MPAVLKRPHPLARQASSQHHQRTEPACTNRDRLLADQLPRRRVDRHDRVRALVCACPHRARSSTRPLFTSTESGHPADTACLGRCHAPIKSRRASPTGDERHNKRKSGHPADSLKESQLAARSGPSPRCRTSPTAQIETASLEALLEVEVARRLLLKPEPVVLGSLLQEVGRVLEDVRIVPI